MKISFIKNSGILLSVLILSALFVAGILEIRKSKPFPLGATGFPDVTTLVDSLTQEQVDWKVGKEKYKRLPSTAYSNVKYKVTEYTGPNGTGYAIAFQYTNDLGVYYNKVIDSGPEPFRTHDWEKTYYGSEF